jgi:hypothetical protein
MRCGIIHRTDKKDMAFNFTAVNGQQHTRIIQSFGATALTGFLHRRLPFTSTAFMDINNSPVIVLHPNHGRVLLPAKGWESGLNHGSPDCWTCASFGRWS